MLFKQLFKKESENSLKIKKESENENYFSWLVVRFLLFPEENFQILLNLIKVANLFCL